MKSQKVPSSYRILRLRSGQDIITRIKGKKGTDLIIERPMQMQVKSLFDGRKQKDILMFRNWLQFSKEQITTVPKDWIAMFLTPEIELVDFYSFGKVPQCVIRKVKSNARNIKIKRIGFRFFYRRRKTRSRL